MTLALLSKTQPDAVTAQRRIAETVNSILTFQHDDSRIRNAAEIAAGVTPTNYSYPPGHIRRYGAQGNATAQSSGSGNDDTAAINAAFSVALNSPAGGGFVYANAGVYRTTAPIAFPLNAPAPIRFYCERGAILYADHNGDAVQMIATNENFSGHSMEDWILYGPNTFLPAVGYVPTSTGAGLSMDRNATTNAVTAYNCYIKNIWSFGFKYGVALQCAIGCVFEGGVFRYNQYGLYVDGGQTNANHFTGVHIRENRVAGVYSTGRSGGSLTVATANVFVAGLFETNIPFPFVSGGNPPTDSMAIYLNNSYDWQFIDCYSENHAAAIYLTNSSKGNQFINHRLSGGTGRFDQIILDGAGIYSNTFNVKHASSQSATEVHVISNNANQLYNKFSGEGLNYIAANILAPLDFNDMKPSLNYVPATGAGLIKLPTWGATANVTSGTNPGQINGIGTTTATLNAKGLGEIALGSGITSNTTINTITNLTLGQQLILRHSGASGTVTIKSDGLNGNYSTRDGLDVALTTIGQAITFEVTFDGSLKEIGRNFFGGSTATTVGAAGGATALPATPLGYMIVTIGGNQVKIPYYNL